MRLIDARYIINRITEERRRWGDDYDVDQVLGDIEDAPTIDSDKLPSANQWIHCSEKMPDKFGMYWVCTKGGYQVQAELTVNMGGHVEEPLVVWNLPFGYPKTEVVAWMPLPEPWKGE